MSAPRLLLTLLAAATVAGTAPAQRAPAAHGAVVADTFWSQSLGTRKEVVVWLPPSYGRQPSRHYPVAYYLHGLGGNEWDWVRHDGLAAVMDSLVAAGMPEMVVVMPDGDDSWYTTWHRLPDYGTCRRSTPRNGESVDAYCVPWPHYDDYIAHDLVTFIDHRYRTLASRAHRAIAGLSMGGYGAVALALRYPLVFAAAASHSGVLVPREWAPSAIDTVLARPAADSGRVRAWRAALVPSMTLPFGPDSIGWKSRDPVVLLDQDRAAHLPLPALFADCGTADTFVEESRAFRDALRRRGVALDYREHPGGHAAAYWRAHVGESLSWLSGRIGR